MNWGDFQALKDTDWNEPMAWQHIIQALQTRPTKALNAYSDGGAPKRKNNYTRPATTHRTRVADMIVQHLGKKHPDRLTFEQIIHDLKLSKSQSNRDTLAVLVETGKVIESKPGRWLRYSVKRGKIATREETDD